MSGWKTQNSLKRIFNTFKRLKSQIYSQDIEALKELSESLENNQKTYVNDNLLYAKLLSVILRQNMELYGDMKHAIKDVNYVLAQPLENHILHLTRSLNKKAEIDYLKSIGIKFTNYKKDVDNPLLNEKQTEILNMINKSWTYEMVTKSFYNSANDFLQDINNYQ